MQPGGQAVRSGSSSCPRSRGSSHSGHPLASTSSLSTRRCRYAARAIPAASAALFALAQSGSSTRPWSMIFFELVLRARCARPLTADIHDILSRNAVISWEVRFDTRYVTVVNYSAPEGPSLQLGL